MSDVPRFNIPNGHLPKGFAEHIERLPEQPPLPRPAATIVLLRDDDQGPQALLMRRSRSSGFVPGAYVFPGGRVDGNEDDPGVVSRLTGLTRSAAADRLGLAPNPAPPAVEPLAFYLAALREAFEETGLLVAQLSETDTPPPSAAHAPRVDALRRALMDDEISFAEVLERMNTRIQGADLAYLAHWITPVQEPRRYDTRFFLGGVPGGSEAVIDPREMVDALWLRPTEALDQNREGRLPMVFPTLHTLELLTDFGSVSSALEAFRTRAIPCILPRLVRTSTGVGIEVPDEI